MLLAPSILSADFGHLADEVSRVERAGAGVVHVDVMDGHFVPNLTVGPLVVRAVRRASSLPIDVHLMIEHADRYLDAFADAGASWISLHAEAMPHLERTVSHLAKRGVRPGVVLNPSTPLVALEEILPEVGYVLIMSVNPGFGGQAFLPSSVDKIRRLRGQIKDRGLAAETGVPLFLMIELPSNVIEAERFIAEMALDGGSIGSNDLVQTVYAVSRDDRRMVEYVRDHPEIRDVIVSGGDPLTLPLEKLEFFLANLAAIGHVDVIRVGTRVPVTLPQRLDDDELIAVLSASDKVWIQTHFNHAREVTPEVARGCRRLRMAGLPLTRISLGSRRDGKQAKLTPSAAPPIAVGTEVGHG